MSDTYVNEAEWLAEPLKFLHMLLPLHKQSRTLLTGVHAFIHRIGPSCTEPMYGRYRCTDQKGT